MNGQRCKLIRAAFLLKHGRAPLFAIKDAVRFSKLRGAIKCAGQLIGGKRVDVETLQTVQKSE